MATIDASSTPEDLDGDRGFAYAKGQMVSWLMATGLEPDRAWDLARRVEDRLAGCRRLSLEELRAVAREVLGAEAGELTAERFSSWHDFLALGRPLVVLIGGASGVGKSTVATQLARHLGITRVSSTDFIRQVLRSVVPEAIAPELGRSSYELVEGEFERQAREVLVGVKATIERAVREGTPVIFEGIHLFPELLDASALPDTLVVEVVLDVEDDQSHVQRFEVRAQASDRPAARYEDRLDTIRRVQQHLVAGARRTGVPIVENRRLEETVRRVLDLVYAGIDRALAGQHA